MMPRNGVIKQQDKKREREGVDMRGGLYVLVKVALRNKSSFECAATQKGD